MFWEGEARGGASFPDDSRRQKDWDHPIVKRNWDLILREVDQVSKARLLGEAQKESGGFLIGSTVSSLGTLLSSESFRDAISLRVGANDCIPHSNRNGAVGERTVEVCMMAASPRHSAINDVIKRSLQKDGLSSVLEPSGLDRGDRLRPDSIPIFQLSGGRSLVRD